MFAGIEMSNRALRETTNDDCDFYSESIVNRIT